MKGPSSSFCISSMTDMNSKLVSATLINNFDAYLLYYLRISFEIACRCSNPSNCCISEWSDLCWQFNRLFWVRSQLSLDLLHKPISSLSFDNMFEDPLDPDIIGLNFACTYKLCKQQLIL
jgi:hypothetical protein